MNEGQLQDFRGSDVAMIFQEPMTALDPVFTIGQQIAETVVRHEGSSRAAGMARALELLELVQIPSAKRRLEAYPHELSGGLRQRAMIAVALACKPKLLLADEPTTALDATVQIQVLLLLRKLQEQLGMGVIFVTHDLGVAGEIADRVAVMYAGRVVEEGPVAADDEGAAASLSARAARRHGAWRHARPAADHHPRRAAEPRDPADRLLLRAALRAGGAGLPRGRAAAAFAGARDAVGPLHPGAGPGLTGQRPVRSQGSRSASHSASTRLMPISFSIRSSICGQLPAGDGGAQHGAEAGQRRQGGPIEEGGNAGVQDGHGEYSSPPRGSRRAGDKENELH